MSTVDRRHVIHVTQRKTYKRCRRQWDWECRRELEPKRRPIPFDFGTAIHAALQTYYNPITWKQDRETIKAASLSAFARSMREQWADYLTNMEEDGPDVEDEEEWKKHTDLGLGMIKGYFVFAEANDKFTPFAVETILICEIPDVICSCHGESVFLQGKFDLMVQDNFNEFWLVDYKTASAFYENMLDFLSLDDQIPCYAYLVWKVLGIRVAGGIYNELRKAVPLPPRVLKSGKLSVDKAQPTSLELYLRALQETRQAPTGEYEDFLSYLSANPKEYFRRFYVHRTNKELNILERNLIAEATEMVNPDLPIYPNPSKPNGHCAWCAFRTPCILVSEGGDAEYLLSQGFVKKS